MLLRDLEGPMVRCDAECWINDHDARLPPCADLRADGLFVVR